MTDSCKQQAMKKALRETQTLCAGCSKAEPKIFAPPQTPSRGAQEGQNVIIWRRSLPLPTNPVWWRTMHAISNYRGNRPTNTQTNPQTNTQTHTHTHKQTHRRDRLQYTAPQLARSVIITKGKGASLDFRIASSWYVGRGNQRSLKAISSPIFGKISYWC